MTRALDPEHKSDGGLTGDLLERDKARREVEALRREKAMYEQMAAAAEAQGDETRTNVYKGRARQVDAQIKHYSAIAKATPKGRTSRGR